MKHVLLKRILLLAGSIIFILTTVIIVNFYRDIYNSKKEIATVVSFYTKRRYKGGRQYYPTVKYKTIQGNELSAELDTYLFHEPFIGEQISILYRTDKPEKVYLNTISHIYIGPSLFMLALLGLVSQGFYRVYLRKHDKK